MSLLENETETARVDRRRQVGNLQYPTESYRQNILIAIAGLLIYTGDGLTTEYDVWLTFHGLD